MQRGKNLLLPVAVLLKASHFHDDATRGTVRRVNVYIANANFCCTRPLFRLRNARISSIVPRLNVGLLFDAATREVIAIDGFEWLARRNGHRRRRQRDCAHSSGVCQKYSGDLNGVVFLDGCPRDQRFRVVIATKRSSRTLLDLRPLEVCA